MHYWLMKSEPDVFSYDDLVAKGKAEWDGVRNHAGQGHMKAMRKGDLALDDQSILWLSSEAAIQQDLVLMKRAEDNPAAQWWVEQLFEAPIQDLLKSHGYQLPKAEQSP